MWDGWSAQNLLSKGLSALAGAVLCSTTGTWHRAECPGALGLEPSSKAKGVLEVPNPLRRQVMQLFEVSTRLLKFDDVVEAQHGAADEGRCFSRVWRLENTWRSSSKRIRSCGGSLRSTEDLGS